MVPFRDVKRAVPGRHGTLDPRPVTGLGRAWHGPAQCRAVPGPGLRKKTQAQPWPWPWSMRARAVPGPRPFKGRAWAQALEGPALALEGPALKGLGPSP